MLEKINKDAENLQGLKDLEGFKLKKENNKDKIKKSKEAIKKAEEKFEKQKKEFFAKTGLSFMPKNEAELKEWFEENLKAGVIEYGVNLSNKSNLEGFKNLQGLSKDIMDLLDGKREYNLSIDRYSGNEKIQPSQFEMVRLGDICEFIGGYAFKTEDLLDIQIDNSIPVIKIGSLNKSGHIDLSNTQFSKSEPSLKKFLIRNGDILIAMTGATGLVRSRYLILIIFFLINE